MDAGSYAVCAAEIVDYDVVGAAEDPQMDQFDAFEIHGDAVDIAGEAHASTVGGDIDVLGYVDAVEIEPVDAVLALDGVVRVTLIPLKDVVARAEESDVVAGTAVDEIVTAATVEHVIARKTKQGVCAVAAGQKVALIASEHLLDAAQDVARGVASAAETGRQIDADAERGREIVHGID